MKKKIISVGAFYLSDIEKEAIIEVLDSGRISEGKKVREFEELWSKYIGTEYSIAVNSGTSALIAGLSAYTYFVRNKIKSNRKKVITSPLTYVATSNALIHTGYIPVFVDIDPKTFVITPDRIKEYLKSTKDTEDHCLILPVHLMGYVCDMDEIRKIANEYNMYIIEDAAQSHGSLYKGKKAGSLSLLSIFSFYIAHNIQAGEMGAINTDNEDINHLCRKLKVSGRVCDCLICTRYMGKCPHISLDEEDYDPRFTHDIIGYNFKITEFQAALAITQVKKAEKIFLKRQFNVKYLNEKLKKFSNILQLPVYSPDISYLAYPIVIRDNKVINRKTLRSRLEKEGVETRPLFGCIPTQQPAYSFLKREYIDRLPNADYIGKNGFYIGCHQFLNKDDLDYIVYVFEKILK